MMKKIIIVGVIVLFLAVIFTGCFEDDDDDGGSIDNKLVGEWIEEESGYSLIFNSNGSLYAGYEDINEYVGNWNVKGNEICVSASGESAQCARYEFSNNDNTVTIYFDEEGQVFNKK